jgi:hypothetical protein
MMEPPSPLLPPQQQQQQEQHGTTEICDGEMGSHGSSSSSSSGSGGSGRGDRESGEEPAGNAFPDLVGLLPPLALKPLDLNHLSSTD